MTHLAYPIATVGTAITVVLAFLVDRVGVAIIRRGAGKPQEKYIRRGNLGVLTVLAAAVVLILLWARLFQNKGTFYGLLGAGIALALREPLLSIAGRLSIWAGHLYRVGDRIEFQQMAGDVIGIGIFYTRMLEIGNWIHGDQATGRIVQFPNASVYQHPVYNYTLDFSWIWDELLLPITYASDVAAATEILVKTGEEYTRDFLKSAEGELERLRADYLLPDLNLQPTVFTRVTSNYVELSMRYLVDPRKRRAANSWLYARIFDRVRENANISIGSDTMDLTLHEAKEPAGGQQRPTPQPTPTGNPVQARTTR
ncbi:MAG TPA: mechanosensitive ion channel family protein [Acidobacteriaceae bacterium]|jgi:small-conductance mechanosensitive channel|nr:mechanosensitive ion channel family protein [Acidobacteriaceae bacterium]